MKHRQYKWVLILGALMQCSQAEVNAQGYEFSDNNSGFGGRASNNSFDGGFAGFNRTQAMPQQSFGQPAGARAPSSMSELEQTLNAVDTRAGWNSIPVTGGQMMSTTPVQQMSPAASQPMLAGAQKSWTQGTMPAIRPGMVPGFTPREIMRLFLEGGTPRTGGPEAKPGRDLSGYTSTAYSNYQTAENEAAKAQNDSNTAHYDTSKWNRNDAASRAEYAASNAEYAAQRAEAAAYSGDSSAKGYASLARQAANRARASANQARYNADTIP